MSNTKLPALPSGVEYVGPPDGPEEGVIEDGGLSFTTFQAKYRIGELSVTIGWVVGHVMGSFREPNLLNIEFDSWEHATSDDAGKPHQAFEGISTQVLRSIPMAHARALMRNQVEQLAVAKVRREIPELPPRVKSDADYSRVVDAYLALCAVSVEPIRRLSEMSDESVDTWSARLRRARSKGVLEGKGLHARRGPAFQVPSQEPSKRHNREG